MYHCSAIAFCSLVEKRKTPKAFMIPCTIGSSNFVWVLCDLGAIINYMLLVVYKQLGLGLTKSTSMMADRTIKKPVGILCDVLVKVASFIFFTDFVILNCEVDFEVPIILGKLFFTI